MARKSRNQPTETTKFVTSGSTIRIEQPKSQRKPKQRVSVVISEDYNPVGGFVNFLREHAVVGLAVGFAIGSQAQILVKQLIDSFITPLLSLFSGGQIKNRSFTWVFRGRPAVFDWGLFVYVLLNFIFVLAAIYVIIKVFNLDKLDKPKAAKAK